MTEKESETEQPQFYHKYGIPEYVKEIQHPVHSLKGNNLPVSAFEGGGIFPTNLSRYEKRGIANELPVWIKENCTQCNYCSMVCPHGVIRPFLLTKNEIEKSPPKY